ncbi:MAG: DNA alkylation repair protein [Candidatus Neomarinimicrobiota bacterium]
MNNENIQLLTSNLRAAANKNMGQQMSAYMKNNFPFLGIKSPQRREIVVKCWKLMEIKRESDLLRVVDNLWELPEREFQYVGCDTLKKYKNLLTADAITGLAKLIRSKSWWDTVDSIAAHPVGHVVQCYPETVSKVDAWIHDENMWIRRTAILHQLRFKEKTDSAKLFRYCDLCLEENEFFIRKAIGWALRQYSYIEMDSVLEYVESRKYQLSNLSIREALKVHKRSRE